jgi:hypothetical protein
MSGLVEAHRSTLGGQPLTSFDNLEAQLTNLQRDVILYEAYCKDASILANYVFSLQKNIDAIMSLNGTAAPVKCEGSKVVASSVTLKGESAWGPGAAVHPKGPYFYGVSPGCKLSE